MPVNEETYYIIETGFDIFGRENKRIYNSYSKKEEAEDVANRLNASCINWGENYFVVTSAKNYLKI
ncbi:TPA: hypothetical protein R1960_002174, partial [Staphylococcus delphini]|nr:hypothetical protein [Staphylococcus delphini]